MGLQVGLLIDQGAQNSSRRTRDRRSLRSELRLAARSEATDDRTLTCWSLVVFLLLCVTAAAQHRFQSEALRIELLGAALEWRSRLLRHAR